MKGNNYLPMNAKHKKSLGGLAVSGLVLVLGLAPAFPAQAEEAPATAVTPVARPTPPVTPERAQNAIKEMDMLFSRSSAGKLVGGDKSDAVSTGRQQADALREQAVKALADQNYAEAIRLSNEAKKAFFGATRKSDSGGMLDEKRRNDYKNRLESINALTDALKQVAREFNANIGSAMADINGQLKKAEVLANEKKFVEGRKILDDAYLVAKITIRMIMEGKSREAPKDNSPKGVYDYDAFRNETYQSLINMILDERKKAGVESEQAFLDDLNAGNLAREEGLALGGKKKYEEASAKLGESTSAYKRAVRRAGVQIID